MQAFEHGGVVLMDELDAANPNVLTVLNDAISSRSLYHPHKDAVITAHKDFRVIAAANTFGTGATARYAGRNQLDSASINRFAQIAMGYDENLERSIVQQKIDASSASESLKKAALAWCLRVQAYRKAVTQQDLDIIVGSRAIYTGIKDTFKTVKAAAEVE
jgi:MoxR-like ATPase